MNTTIDFILNNSIDTCAIWNILSARKLCAAVFESGVEIWATKFVLYEALDKPRKNNDEAQQELRSRLRKCLSNKMVKYANIDIDDLKTVEALESRKKLGKGELAAIAFAKKFTLAFLTDDQKARKLAQKYLGIQYDQTVPKLFGWLVFEGMVLDSDKEDIIKEHEQFGGNLARFFRQCFDDAMLLKLYNKE